MFLSSIPQGANSTCYLKQNEETRLQCSPSGFGYPAVKLVQAGGSREQAECETDDVRAQDGC